jgi:hypothetical protein
VGFRLKKVKKKLAIILNYAILNPVSERNNNEINKMNNENIIDRVDSENANLRNQIDRLSGKTEDTVHDGHEVVCCGCGAEVVISLEEVGQWDHGLENYQCWECE